MILTMSADVSAYQSKSQIARVLSETWTANNAYCPRCGAERLLHERGSKPAEDFSCPACGSVYEQKSRNGRFSSKVVDGDYKIMADKIRAKTNPDMLFLSYDGTRSAVVDFFVVLRHFFTIPVIERRTALSEGAPRAGSDVRFFFQESPKKDASIWCATEEFWTSARFCENFNGRRSWMDKR